MENEHTSTLCIVTNLDGLYRNQDKMVGVEEMYPRGLRGKEKARGPEHTSNAPYGHQSWRPLQEPGQDGGGGGDVPAGAVRI